MSAGILADGGAPEFLPQTWPQLHGIVVRRISGGQRARSAPGALPLRQLDSRHGEGLGGSFQE